MIKAKIKKRKIHQFLKNLSFLKKIQKENLNDFLTNFTQILASKQAIYESVQVCIDLAFHVCAINKFSEPSTYRNVFRILNQNDIIDNNLSAKMEQWAGLRNLIAHIYEEVDEQRIFFIIKSDLNDLEKFITKIAELEEIS
ncbi:MAG: type VII toxin-antitoxin system HepT family RNase toxin [Promethearchaeota archaeon]